MKNSTIPVICSVALTATLAAGVSHWWSVRQFIVAVGNGLPVTTPAAPLPLPQPAADSPPALAKASLPPQKKTTAPAAATEPQQKEFYEALIARMSSLQNQNRDLLDQLAETNRDLMKLEFRVDTHSESFRPLPVAESQPFSSLESELDYGVLPPRAEPVDLPSHE